jgi:hypothetical protein
LNPHKEELQAQVDLPTSKGYSGKKTRTLETHKGAAPAFQGLVSSETAAIPGAVKFHARNSERSAFLKSRPHS